MPFTLWFTGLSGSGKTTIARALEIELKERRINVYVLDGDIVRQRLNKDLGFSSEDRIENIRRIAEVARILNDAGVPVITAFISPFMKNREMASEIIGNDKYFEIFIDADLSTCISRDPKGLYVKAIKGLLPDFTGITSPYEKPERPHIHINTADKSIKESVELLIDFLRSEN